MRNIAISVENLGKCYRIGHAEQRPDNFQAAVRSFAVAPFAYLRSRLRQPSEDELFWALKDVSFEVKHGEVLGIIGRNGAGKSTLLKILSRITEPTEGRAKIYGRIGSLLEVGTGFHPELTGRDNIYLNGTILGMKRAEIDKKFDEIVDFSGIEKFLDTPVKRYSSGMYVRLAFAVAAHLDPEILIIDEVLAVGDVGFQKKCLGKMENVAKEGRTVLFVSHNMTAIQSLSERTVWLDKGEVVRAGDAKKIVAQYLHTFSNTLLEQKWDDPKSAPGNEKVKIYRVKIVPEQKEFFDRITVHTPIRIEFEYWNFLSKSSLNLSLHLYTLENICVFNSISDSKIFSPGLIQGVCYIPGNFLNDGIYRVDMMIVQDRSVMLFNLENAAIFEVYDVEREGSWLGKWIGIIRPEFEWSITGA